MARAWKSLEGLSVGDAFGQCFFVNAAVLESLIEQRAIPKSPWNCTDDTVMALSVVETLERFGHIEQDALAELFGLRYLADDCRCYGATAHDILRDIASGQDWRVVAGQVFDGAGSMGNGGAMRAAPIGGFAENEPELAASEAAKSAEVTHAHPEGKAGAIAVAIAAAVVNAASSPAEMFSAVLAYTPQGETHAGIALAAALPLDRDVKSAVELLGNGSRVISQDTVPFSLWCAAKSFNNFTDAMWITVSGLGDRDTTCAIVGGILALREAAGPIPQEWISAREPFDQLPKAAAL